MPESQSTTTNTTAEKPAEEPSIIDSAKDLAQTAVTYARQEVGDIVHDKIVVPTQKAGATFGMALAIGILVAVGLLFVAAGALILLAHWITWPGALFAVGGVLILGSVIVASVRMRSVQK